MIHLRKSQPTREELAIIQQDFAKYFVSEFLRKKRKYEKRMQLVFSGSKEMDSCSEFLALGQSRRDITLAAIKRFRLAGHHIQRSLPNLFHYVYGIVKCYKAASIMHKLEEIEESEIENTLHEVAKELAIAYEYQLGMIAHSTDIPHLAKYAVTCTLQSLKSKDGLFNYSELIKSIVDHSGNFKEQEMMICTKMKVGEFTVKWKISDVFLLPGLRVPVQDCRPPENVSGTHELDPLLPNYKLSAKDSQAYYALLSYHSPCGPNMKDLKKSKKKGNSKDTLPVKEIVIANTDDPNTSITSVSEEITMNNISFRFFCCFSPYGFACDFQVYGFRAPVHVYNCDEGQYEMISRDMITTLHPEKCEIPLDVGFHQSYIPKTGCLHMKESQYK